MAEKPESWTGVKDTLVNGNGCSQPPSFFDPQAPRGTEDCLFINVYTPDLKPTNNLTVMVYMHGGGYTVGSGSDRTVGPDFLIDQDVVFVSSKTTDGTYIGWSIVKLLFPFINIQFI